MKKYKFLFGSLEEIGSFLKAQAAMGQELLAVNKLSFAFRKTEKKFKYFVYFIAYKREASQESLIEDLIKNDIEYFYYSFNRLNSDFYKLGRARKIGEGADDAGLNEVYKDEVLIIKCPDDKVGDFSWIPDESDLTIQAKSMEKTYLIITIILLLLSIFSACMTIVRMFQIHLLVITVLLLAMTFYYFSLKRIYFKIRRDKNFGGN